MRVLTALTLALLAAPALASEDPPPAPLADDAPPVIEAWCDGGIDGRYQHVTATPDGEIRAANGWLTEKPWPVVANDPAAAERWFAAVEAADPLPPPEKDDEDVVIADGLYCGVSLTVAGETTEYDLPEVHREMVVHIPGYH